MTEDGIDRYDNFNTKGCPEDLIFGVFNNQPIPSTYYDLTNDYDDNGTPIYADLENKKEGEDEVVPNYENNIYKSHASEIDPLQNEIMENEEVDIMSNENEEREIE